MEKEKLTLVEILKILKGQGIPITKRTFEFYQKLRLLPKPERVVGKGGRGVYGYYSPNVIGVIKIIHQLKDEGLTLGDIHEKAEKIVIDRYKEVLKKWGFSDYILSEMKETPGEVVEKVNQEEKEEIKSFIKTQWKTKLSNEEIEGVANLFTSDATFEKNLLKTLFWFNSNETIEASALMKISEEANSMIVGLFFAASVVGREIGATTSSSSSIEKDIANAMFQVVRKFYQKITDLQILYSKVNKRLAEILGEYGGRKKEVWEEIIKMWERNIMTADEKKEVDLLYKSLEGDIKK